MIAFPPRECTIYRIGKRTATESIRAYGLTPSNVSWETVATAILDVLRWTTFYPFNSDADLRPSKLLSVRGYGLVVCTNCQRWSGTTWNDSAFDNGHLH